MPKIYVYRFELFDPADQAWKPAPHFGTREHIDAQKGAVLFNSKLEIDSAHLSPEGTYASGHKPWRP